MASQIEQSTEHRDKKPRISKDSFDTIVQVLVGPDQTTFSMHKGLLCSTAPYFRAVFEGEFIESKSQVLCMPDEDLEIFKQLQHWAYTDNILEQGEACRSLSFDLLGKLYLFGHTRGITTLQNATIDIIIDNMSERQNFRKLIPLVYEKMPEDVPLRRLLVEFSARWGTLDKWFTEEKKDEFEYYTKEFLADLAVAMFKLRKGTLAVMTSEKDLRASRKTFHITIGDAS